MMGSSGGSDNVTDVLSLIDNDQKYVAKIKELDARVKSADTALDQAKEQSRQAQEHRTLAEKAFAQAQKSLTDANAVKASNEKAAKVLDDRDQQNHERELAHAASVAEFNKHKLAAEADLADRSQNIANRDNEIEVLRKKAEADRDEILESANDTLFNARKVRVAANADAADLAAKRKDFMDFVARMKGWEFT